MKRFPVAGFHPDGGATLARQQHTVPDLAILPQKANEQGRTLSSHFTLRAPTTPGTTALTGKPWSLGMGSPFISNANRTSPLGSTAMPAGMDEP